ncbi:hypothetical protein [Nonomuraea rubra]
MDVRGRDTGGGLPGATAAEGTRIAFSGHDILRARDGGSPSTG